MASGQKAVAATVAVLKIVVIRGFKGEDFNGIYDQRVSSLEVEPCAENPAPSWVRVQRHESRVNSMPVMPGFWKAVASDVMPKHEYSEADVGAAQIRLVSHRIATIISSATAALARSRSLSSVATSVARAALGTPVGGGGRETSLILKSLCMFPAGKALLGRVEERVCQLRKILQEHSTIEGVFPRAVAAFEKDF